jgi:predicted Zn-dependent protease
VRDLDRLRAALTEDPTSKSRRIALIRALLARGEAREALGHLDAESTDADERTWLAAALRGIDRTRRAERVLVEVLAADPLHIAALRLYGRILIDRGRPADAIEPLLRLRRLAPGDAGGLALLARAHRHLGPIDPYDPSAHCEFARLWESTGEWEHALECWTVAAELVEHPDEELERHRAEAAARTREAGGSPWVAGAPPPPR